MNLKAFRVLVGIIEKAEPNEIKFHKAAFGYRLRNIDEQLSTHKLSLHKDNTVVEVEFLPRLERVDASQKKPKIEIFPSHFMVKKTTTDSYRVEVD